MICTVIDLRLPLSSHLGPNNSQDSFKEFKAKSIKGRIISEKKALIAGIVLCSILYTLYSQGPHCSLPAHQGEWRP
jgi:hypothetical protein